MPETNVYAKSVKIYPSECRQRAATYKAKLSVTFKWMINSQLAGGATKILGQVPIMVKVSGHVLHSVLAEPLYKGCICMYLLV